MTYDPVRMVLSLSNAQTPGFTVTKDARYSPSDAVYAAPQERVDYDIVAKNSGNVDLTGVVVADPMFAGRPYKPFPTVVLVNDQSLP